ETEVMLIDPFDSKSIVDLFVAVLAKTKALLSSDRQLLVIAPAEIAHDRLAPIVALFRTAAIERPGFRGALIEVEGELSAARVRRIVAAEGTRTDARCHLRYDTADARAASLRRASPQLPAQVPALDPEAVYWITGGLGGLGSHFAAHLISRG